LNPKGIDGVAAGFYLEARLQVKSCRHSSKDAVSNRRKGFSLFSLKTRDNVKYCSHEAVKFKAEKEGKRARRL
jgi:hypothetical protein